MNRIVRSSAAGLLFLFALPFFSGCTAPKPAEPSGEVKVAVDDLPAGVLDAAKKQQPGVDFQWAEKRWDDGVLVYKLQGQSGEGKIHEVDVTATGEVVAPQPQ